jgi:hypothetical protein
MYVCRGLPRTGMCDYLIETGMSETCSYSVARNSHAHQLSRINLCRHRQDCSSLIPHRAQFRPVRWMSERSALSGREQVQWKKREKERVSECVAECMILELFKSSSSSSSSSLQSLALPIHIGPSLRQINRLNHINHSTDTFTPYHCCTSSSSSS